MPLTLAWHCSKLEKPQLSPPMPPEYWAHHDALAGVCVSTAGIITSAATITLTVKRIPSLLILIGKQPNIHTPSAVLAHGRTSNSALRASFQRSSMRPIALVHRKFGSKSKIRQRRQRRERWTELSDATPLELTIEPTC